MRFSLQPVDPALLSDVGIERPVSFLQTPFWATFKASQGWKPFYFTFGNGSQSRYPLVVLCKSLGRFGSFAYVPMGPHAEALEEGNESASLAEIATILTQYLPKTVIFIRFDPPVPELAVLQGKTAFCRGSPVKSAYDVQPPDTVVLDLQGELDDILEGMKPKWRYNVRLGEKKGVKIRTLAGTEAAETGIEAFYRLYRETAARDGIAIHDETYYRDLFKASVKSDLPADIRLYLASHEGRDIAAIIVLFGESGATYLYGASSNEKRNLMPAYALQWRAIGDAREAGCKTYDFYGIPPTDNPSHPMHGLYRFKTGFGGRIVHRVGSVDIPIKLAPYAFWRFAETARTFWYKGLKKAIRQAIRRKS